jgi:regulator of sigma E protease
MNIFIYISAFIFLIMVITAVHEAGHFFVARFFKVKILDFSIGMGKSIKTWKDKYNTEFNLRVLPIGGFVRMLGEDDKNENSTDSFSSKHYYQKTLILLAGPLANFLLAVMLFTGLNIYGNTTISSIAGQISKDSPAFFAGIEENDLILEIDSSPVISRADAQMVLARRLGETGKIDFILLSDGSRKNAIISINEWLQGEEPSDLLYNIGINVPIEPVIGKVVAESPADISGLKPGDRILSINGTNISSWSEIKSQINLNSGLPSTFYIERGDFKESFLITPSKSENQKNNWLIGIVASNKISEKAKINQSYGFLAALGKASSQTYNTVTDSFTFLYKMIIGYVSPKNLGGPVMIGQFAGDSIIYGGVYSFLLLLCFVSIGLGVINLVPIPILDGGQILILTIEKIKGSPIPPKVLDFTYRIGISAVILLMIFAFVNDISRIGLS